MPENNFEPKIIGFMCNWCSYRAADLAGSARIKYAVGPTIAWYQDWLRYYFLTVESNPDGSMSRRFAVLVLLLCLFGMLVILLRRGRVPGLASGPAWRLLGRRSAAARATCSAISARSAG